MTTNSVRKNIYHQTDRQTDSDKTRRWPQTLCERIFIIRQTDRQTDSDKTRHWPQTLYERIFIIRQTARQVQSVWRKGGKCEPRACKLLAQKDNKRRQDKVCSHLHWCLSKVYWFAVEEKWHQHKPEKVEENEHRRPDITVIDKTTNKCLLVDVAIPGDHNIMKKEKEKIDNYSELRVEIAILWQETTVVQVVIGALGPIPKKLKFHLERIGISPIINTFQSSALLGWAHILR